MNISLPKDVASFVSKRVRSGQSTDANAVVIEADESTGLASDIERLSYSLDELNLMGGAGA